jgi:hypothetical protein
MKIKHILLILLPALFAGNVLMAQQGDEASDKKDKIEAFKVSFLSQKLKLSPEEARVFWPVYNQYQDELETVRRNWKKETSTVKATIENMTDKEIEKLVDGEIVFRQNEMDVKKKYHIQLKKVLPLRKLAILYRAEEEFKRELLKRIQEKTQSR